MIDRCGLESHFEWLAGSKWFDQVLGDAALAIELTAADCGDELMRDGYAWRTADGVVEVSELGEFVELVRDARAKGLDPLDIAARP